jgi:hypothetical protein
MQILGRTNDALPLLVVYLRCMTIMRSINKNFKIAKSKEKTGIIDKVVDKRNIIGRNLFNKETPINPFLNMKIVLTNTGEVGKITGAFGKSGKFKARFDVDLEDTEELKGKPLHMPFNKLIFDATHKMVQTI